MQVYADNAATTKISSHALQAMMPCFEKFYGNPSSLHTVGQEANEVLQDARARVAACLGCEPREIFFTSGGSEADNQAIRSAAFYGAKKGKKHIISTAFEHHAVLHTLNALEKEGFEITLLDVKNNHNVTAQQVKDAIREDTCLVTCMYANNEIGSVLPIAEIGAVCKAAEVPFHIDAVQAAGKIPFKLAEMNIDMLSISGHKFHSPKGVGALYIKRGTRFHPFIIGGHQENGRRAGTENIASIVGMGKAAELALAHVADENTQVKALRDKLEQTVLNTFPCVRVYGDVTIPGQLHQGKGFPFFQRKEVYRDILLVGYAVELFQGFHFRSFFLSRTKAAYRRTSARS